MQVTEGASAVATDDLMTIENDLFTLELTEVEDSRVKFSHTNKATGK